MRIRMLFALAVCSVGYGVPAPRRAHADDPKPRAQLAGPRADAEAHALFSAGALALEDGRFEEALAHFKRAYELSGRPEIWFDIGVAHDRLRHDREAMRAFQNYLELSHDHVKRTEAEARVSILRRTLDEKSEAEKREQDQASAPAPAKSADAHSATPNANQAAPAEPRTTLEPARGKRDGASTRTQPPAVRERTALPSPTPARSANTKPETKPRTIIAAPAPGAPIQESPLLR